MVYSDAEYTAMLEGQSMKDLKNMVTTIVKHVRFTLTGKRKAEIIAHLVKHTQFDDVAGVTLRGDITKVPEEDLLRETSVTASGMKRKARADTGSIKPTGAKAMKMKAPMLAEIKARPRTKKVLLENAIREKKGGKFNEMVQSKPIPMVKIPSGPKPAVRQPRKDKGVKRGPRKAKEVKEM